MNTVSLPSTEAADALRECNEQNPRLTEQVILWVENGATWVEDGTEYGTTTATLTLPDEEGRTHSLLTLEWDQWSEAEYFPGAGFWDI